VNLRPWLAGAVSVAAVMLGFGTAASASTTAAHHAVTSHIKPLRVARNIHVPRTVLPHLQPEQEVKNADWSGYAAVADKAVALRYVTADFNVPSVNCAASPAGSAGTYEGQWVGLDGYNTRTVEQTGIAGYCTSGVPAYYAWYEMYPAAPVAFTGSINPGDAIRASVYYNASTKQYDIALTDVTTQQGLNVNVACQATSCKNASAEAISEVPGGGPSNGYTLADYGMENFTGGAVTSRSGLRGGFGKSSLWTSSEVAIVDGSGLLMSQPSSLYGGAAFNDTWLAGD